MARMDSICEVEASMVEATKQHATMATCNYCQKIFDDEPKILPNCLHTFCSSCLEKLPITTTLKKTKDVSCSALETSSSHSSPSQPRESPVSMSAEQPVTPPEPHGHSDERVPALMCPKCECYSPLPESGVKGYQTAFVFQEAVTTYRHIENCSSETPKCEQCLEDDPAVGFCESCSQLICEICLEKHKRWTAYSGHSVVDLNTYLHVLKSESTPPKLNNVCSATCSKHSNEKIKFYCASCKELLCHDCTVVVHRDHPTESITAELLKQNQEQMVQLFDELKCAGCVVEEQANLANSQRNKLDLMCSKLKDEITAEFSKLEESLKSRKQQLLSDVDKLTVDPLTALEEHSSSVESLRSRVLESKRLLEAYMSQKCSTGLLSIEGIVSNHVSELYEECSELASLSDVPDLTFTRDDHLKDTIQSHGSIMCDGHSSDSAADTPLSFSIEDFPSSSPLTIDREKMFYSSLVFEAPPSLIDTYTCSSLPTSGLAHKLAREELTHSLDPRLTTNTPIISRGPLSPAIFSGSAVRTIDGLDHPIGIAVSNNIVVCEFKSHRVSFFQHSGRKFCTMGGEGEESDGQFVFPQKVVVNHQGNMVISDGTCRLQIFTANGLWLKTVKTDFIPAGVTVGRNYIFASDKVQHHIKVFKHDLTFHGIIGSRGNKRGEFNHPSGIVSDHQGLLYIADTWNHRIQVLKEDGTFVRMFGKKGSTSGCLNSPGYLCLDPDGQFLFVSEGRNNRVSMFTTSGSFVKCFGCEGTGLGELSQPKGLAMDFNSLLYVCDYGNNRIHLFK